MKTKSLSEYSTFGGTDEILNVHTGKPQKITYINHSPKGFLAVSTTNKTIDDYFNEIINSLPKEISLLNFKPTSLYCLEEEHLIENFKTKDIKNFSIGCAEEIKKYINEQVVKW